jgi:hypothetical protein
MIESARRASLTGAANNSAGHKNRCRELSALSKAGWSTIFGRPRDLGRRCIPTFCWRLKDGTPGNHRHRQASSACAFGPGSLTPVPPWSNLIGYLQLGEQAADRAGCLDTPPRRAPGNGVLPEPFASFWTRPTGHGASRMSGHHMPLRARSPVRAAECPGGASRHTRRQGEAAPPGVVTRKLPRPVSFSSLPALSQLDFPLGRQIA